MRSMRRRDDAGFTARRDTPVGLGVRIVSALAAAVALTRDACRICMLLLFYNTSVEGCAMCGNRVRTFAPATVAEGSRLTLFQTLRPIQIQVFSHADAIFNYRRSYLFLYAILC